MRAITVRQPYAWAIIHGGKDVENRSRNIAGTYRGVLAIHAALQVADDSMPVKVAHAIGEWRRANPGVSSRVAHPVGATLTDGNAIATWYGNRGAIIGVVDLVDVHRSRNADPRTVCFDNQTPIGSICSPWAQQFEVPGGYHLVLANPRPLATPIPCRGRLGLWTVPDDIAARIEAGA